jgi:hypothetical protein
MKNMTSGVTILLAAIALLYLFRVVWFIAVLFMPFLIVIAALYFLGYHAPEKVHLQAEKKIREGLDWLDFKAPEWTWPWILRARSGLDWLGLQVKKAS